MKPSSITQAMASSSAQQITYYLRIPAKVTSHSDLS
jgi:hypothetical protein